MSRLFLWNITPTISERIKIPRSRWRYAVYAVWFFVTVLAVVHYIASIPPVVDNVRQTVGTVNTDGLVAYFVALDILVSCANILMGILLFWRSGYERMALYISFTMIAFGSTTVSRVDVFSGHIAFWAILVNCIAFLGQMFFICLFYLFPDGRFVPRWIGIFAALLVLLISYIYIFPYLHLSAQFALSIPLILILLSVFTVSGTWSQIYRYRSVSNMLQRQQTRWVIFGFTLMICMYLLYIVMQFVLRQTPEYLLFLLVGQTLVSLVIIFLPLSVGMAILRYRLFVNRTLVYGALTASILCIYGLVVGVLAVIFQASNNIFASLLATGLVAVLIQPLRSSLQRSVNRLMYGERDDPATVLTRLGQRLTETLQPDAILKTLVETVAQSLKLPYAAVNLKQADEFVSGAVYGTLQSSERNDLLRLPLQAQSELVGEMLLAPRGVHDTFTHADQKLLREFARQAGLAVQAARLNADLQRSRERLVLTREEERRRIRRDLHDGLAPTLAALALSASIITDVIPTDPQTAVRMADELQQEIRNAIADIRRLVYDLRPPTLDQLGLVAALREYIAQQVRPQNNGEEIATTERLYVTLNVPETLPVLSAAVEVATYRIVQEALANVKRHAYASNCLVQLSLSNMLQIEIIDDGVGLPDNRRIGVGLLSMRERAQELGGTCLIEKFEGAGTRVYAQLPLTGV